MNLFNEIKKVLDKHNINIELYSYKEHQTMDGYWMYGKLKVNGKPAFEFTNEGLGGPTICNVLNQKNAQPLLNIKKELNKIKYFLDKEKKYESKVSFENILLQDVINYIKKKEKVDEVFIWDRKEKKYISDKNIKG